MKTAKQEVQELLDSLPEDVSSESILEEMLLLQTLKERVAQVERGETVSHEQVKSRWLPSTGA
jgi:hypothetical protein